MSGKRFTIVQRNRRSPTTAEKKWWVWEWNRLNHLPEEMKGQVLILRKCFKEALEEAIGTKFGLLGWVHFVVTIRESCTNGLVKAKRAKRESMFVYQYLKLRIVKRTKNSPPSPPLYF
jgi:hypothetical protein